MGERNFVLKGDIVHSKSPGELETLENGYLVCVRGKSAGLFPALPGEYRNLPHRDYSGNLILPGLTDLHVHAPQFGFRALGMDLELLDWLHKNAFPEEAKFQDSEYAGLSYGMFAEALKRSPSCRAVIFATLHTPATLLLMEKLEETGLVCFVGKLNMDRNCPPYLREESAAVSLSSTRDWLEKSESKLKSGNIRPILSPRFIPSCSDELLRGLAGLQKEYGRKRPLPLQSHLSENRQEIAWVKELCPRSRSYAGAYSDFGLFGEAGPAVMAHCVWPEDEEIELIKKQGVYIAHCPQSNTNLSSGIAPVRRFLEVGIKLGLGTDVAGGVHLSVFRAMSDAIQVSKLRQALIAPVEKALSLEEAFYLGSAGGGAFFEEAGMGRSGGFDAGNDFDALVFDDMNPVSGLAAPLPLSLRDRLERLVYLAVDGNIRAKYVRGLQVL
ncbi:MAG: amidohydrolase family protein [Treponema sp.]|nr:amidohydrolase family protein [Treponema sp.]